MRPGVLLRSRCELLPSLRAADEYRLRGPGDLLRGLRLSLRHLGPLGVVPRCAIGVAPAGSVARAPPASADIADGRLQHRSDGRSGRMLLAAGSSDVGVGDDAAAAPAAGDRSRPAVGSAEHRRRSRILLHPWLGRGAANLAGGALRRRLRLRCGGALASGGERDWVHHRASRGELFAFRAVREAHACAGGGLLGRAAHRRFAADRVDADLCGAGPQRQLLRLRVGALRGGGMHRAHGGLADAAPAPAAGAALALVPGSLVAPLATLAC
mmetsp:Transcript_118970/g.344099  ORF Transcript_118970/g.344099 Transcript_118970/m.344099 type:complete len:269 (-) Transcript_118970:533-1339(-)